MSNDEQFRLLQEMRSSFALKVEGRLITLHTNFFVFRRNYAELRKVLQATQDTKRGLELWDLKNHEKLNVVINEIIRLLHNYLASAKTLVDHTRILISEWYKDSTFLKEYNQEIKLRFSNNSLSGFIEGLRNYSLHYTLPLANASMKLDFEKGGKGIEPLFSFILHKSDLLYWSNWPDKAKAYISNVDEEISVNEITDEYYQQVENFHNWIFKRLTEIHSDELAWLETIKKKILALMPEDERKARGLDQINP